MLKDKMRWIYFSDMLKDEYRQCKMEGKDVENYIEKIDMILKISSERAREEAAEKLLAEMEQEKVRKEFPYEEPVEYEKIVNSLQEKREDTFAYDKKQAEDKLRGAWYGRTAGCVLGIPVEGWQRRKIEDYLKESGQYPLANYITSSDDQRIRDRFGITEIDVTTPYDRQKVCWFNCLQGQLPNDDDLNYTVAALKTVERFGRNFTSHDIAETWLLGIPPLHTCTAERAAVRNFMTGILPPESAWVCNPYREWIGAQIRGDFFGYINPGNPHEAARMAYADGSVSHTKNGVYGEMFIAALLSLCYLPELTMKERIKIAMQQIPPASRLHKSLEDVCILYDAGESFEELVDEVHGRFDENSMFDWCLTIPNAMLVCACLLWNSDFDSAVSAAVLAGFDTDCNGATVGSVMGLANGFQSINPKWYSPFDGNLHTSVHGLYEISLEDAVRRTLTHILGEAGCS